MNDQVVFELCGGPQDGAKVHRVGPTMPRTIYVGPKWLGDGYAAWGVERCERFPCQHLLFDGKFIYQGNHP